jgi:AcrR family transcriptional regulator
MAGSELPGGTRQRVTAAALRCFLAGGYEQTTIAQIRAESGVSNGALFHHFPAKEAIAEAIYVDGIRSYQDGLWSIVGRPPGSLRAAVRAVIGHQLAWTEQHPDHARFIYQRGHLDFDTAGGAAVDALNRELAAEFGRWMAPLADQIRPMSMLMVTAIVTGPAHALARRWLAGHLRGPLSGYAGELAEAACAGLQGAPADPGEPSADGRRRPAATQGRITVELLDADGLVTGRGEGTVQLARP